MRKLFTKERVWAFAGIATVCLFALLAVFVPKAERREAAGKAPVEANAQSQYSSAGLFPATGVLWV